MRSEKQKRHPVLGGIIMVCGIMLIVAGFGGLSGNDDQTVIKGGASPAPEQSEPMEEIATVGDSVDVRNVLVTLNSIEESNGSAYNEPSDGNVFLLCDFTIENNSNREINISSMVSFTAYADDYALNYSLSALRKRRPPAAGWDDRRRAENERRDRLRGPCGLQNL